MEAKAKTPWTWRNDDRDTDRATLHELKAELGIPDSVTGKDLAALDVRTAVESAVATHAEHTQPSYAAPGYTKAYNLEAL